MKATIKTEQKSFLLTLQVTEKLSTATPAGIFSMILLQDPFRRGVSRITADDEPGRCSLRIDSGLSSTYKVIQAIVTARNLIKEFSEAQPDSAHQDLANQPSVKLDIILDDQEISSLSALKGYFKCAADQLYALGAFELSQPTLVIADPCYVFEYEGGCAGAVQAKVGRWEAEVSAGITSWGTRVKALQARHESAGAEVYDLEFIDSGLSIGVDSGQCGVFDVVRYSTDAFDYDDTYEKVCSITLDSELGGGILPNSSGAVVQSGFGDGVYSVLVRENAEGQVIAVKVIFIGAEDGNDF